MTKKEFDFAEKTYKRFQMLYVDTIISRQEMDEMEFKHVAALNEMEAADAIYTMAKKGIAITNLSDEQKDIQPLLDFILSHVHPASRDFDKYVIITVNC